MQGLGKLFLIFVKIGAFTFGGGYAMLPIIYRELCETHDYVPEEEMEEMVVLAQAMPGPMAVNCAAQVGYKLYGKIGSFVCAMGLVLPSYLIIVLLANLLITYSDNRYVTGAFQGIRAVAAGMILAAAVKMFKPIAHNKMQIAVMIAVFLAAVSFKINSLIYIVLGGLFGYIVSSGAKGGQAK